jgi:hypothetical protein
MMATPLTITTTNNSRRRRRRRRRRSSSSSSSSRRTVFARIPTINFGTSPNNQFAQNME